MSFQGQIFKRLEAIVKLEAIVPNEWNPNEMTPADFDALKGSLQKVGNNSLQSIIIRPNPRRAEEGEPDYEIVDGFHRYQALKDLGMTDAYCQIINFPDSLARIYTIAMNKNRGEFDTLKLANLLAELKNTYGFDESMLEEELGYSDDEVKALLSMTDVNLDNLQEEDDLPDHVLRDDEGVQLNQELTFNLTPEQKATIEQAIQETGIANQSEALCLICKDYLVSKGKAFTPPTPKADTQVDIQPETADTQVDKDSEIVEENNTAVSVESKPENPSA